MANFYAYMNNWIIYGIGFGAQIFFGARLITQWILSEKAKEVQTPSMFWKFSLFASILLFIYGYLRRDLAIMLGQVLIYIVYIRNLQLQDQWKSVPLLKITGIGLPVIIASYLYLVSDLQWMELIISDNIPMWLVGFGVLGQLIFNGRFIYQWLYSEKNKESSLPLGFWVLSLIGAGFIFTYAIFRKDPVLLASHLFGGVVYARNLYLLKHSVA